MNIFTPSYLSNLLPQTVKQKSGLILRHASNFILFPVRTERFIRYFFPSTTLLWNSIDYDQRITLSISVSKQYLNRFFGLSNYNKLFDYSIDRYSSILHIRLRLNCCTLNYYLFKIDCLTSPACICGENIETVTHYLLKCPRYSALRFSLLSAAAQVCGDGWNLLSDSLKLKLLLFRAKLNGSTNELFS